MSKRVVAIHRAITEQIDCLRHRQGETLVYKFSTNPTFLPHYEKIIKMIRFLNLIQEVHEKLLESKASPNEPTIELLMLNGHQN